MNLRIIPVHLVKSSVFVMVITFPTESIFALRVRLVPTVLGLSTLLAATTAASAESAVPTDIIQGYIFV